MSFVKNECQQLTLNDNTFSLTDRKRRMLEKSWAKHFAEKIFPQIDEEAGKRICQILADPDATYREKAGRLSTLLNEKYQQYQIFVVLYESFKERRLISCYRLSVLTPISSNHVLCKCWRRRI